jgi:hypothetical protein
MEIRRATEDDSTIDEELQHRVSIEVGFFGDPAIKLAINEPVGVADRSAPG